MAQNVKLDMLVTKYSLLLGHKNAANGLFYSSQLWQHKKTLLDIAALKLHISILMKLTLDVCLSQATEVTNQL
jgi:hypothetical protein